MSSISSNEPVRPVRHRGPSLLALAIVSVALFGFPLGRIGVPEDVAFATLFLASECSSWITGVTVDISGGRVIV
jgi:NAD(P)-dependent dehydrogenase (short-subunit alcohol dehydrogenase family)